MSTFRREVTCLGCGKIGPNMGRSLCGSCYAKDQRSRHPPVAGSHQTNEKQMLPRPATACCRRCHRPVSPKIACVKCHPTIPHATPEDLRWGGWVRAGDGGG